MSLRSWIYAVFCLLIVGQAPKAEQVHLSASAGINEPNRQGQGWLFAGPDDLCWVVTAAHVIDGATSIAATGPGQRTGYSMQPATRIDPDIDIAFVPIEGDLANPCSGPVYGYSNVEPVLQRLAQTREGILLDHIHQGGQQSTVQATVAGNEHDEVHFVVRIPESEDLFVSRGMSGSPLRLAGSGTDAGLPIGIVIEALPMDGGAEAIEAAAVRMDVIRSFVLTDLASGLPRHQDRPLAENRVEAALLEATGSVQTACGPMNAILGTGECGWRPLGAPWSHIVLALQDGPIARPEIRIQFGPATSPVSVLARTSPTDQVAGARWTTAHHCEFGEQQSDATCRRNDASVHLVRLDIEGQGVEIVSIEIVRTQAD